MNGGNANKYWTNSSYAGHITILKAISGLGSETSFVETNGTYENSSIKFLKNYPSIYGSNRAKCGSGGTQGKWKGKAGGASALSPKFGTGGTGGGVSKRPFIGAATSYSGKDGQAGGGYLLAISDGTDY